MKVKERTHRYCVKSRIVLRFSNCNSWEHCMISDHLFEQGVGPAFFLDGDYSKSVCEEVALKNGFRVNQSDWQKLVDGYWKGMLQPKEGRQ